MFVRAITSIRRGIPRRCVAPVFLSGALNAEVVLYTSVTPVNDERAHSLHTRTVPGTVLLLCSGSVPRGRHRAPMAKGGPGSCSHLALLAAIEKQGKALGWRARMAPIKKTIFYLFFKVLKKI